MTALPKLICGRSRRSVVALAACALAGAALGGTARAQQLNTITDALAGPGSPATPQFSTAQLARATVMLATENNRFAFAADAETRLRITGPWIAVSPGIFPPPTSPPGYSPQSGLQIRVDASEIGNYGYQPVHVEFLQRKAAVADRRITMRFRTYSYYLDSPELTVEKTFTLEKGNTSVRGTLLVPRLRQLNFFSWDVAVDGLRDVSLQYDLNRSNLVSANQPTGLRVLMSHAAAGDLAGLEAALQISGAGAGPPRVTSVAPDETPTNWLEYTTYDLVVMPASGLTALGQQRPQAIKALLHWVRAGGNLWLVDAGANWEQLAEVNRALDLDPIAVDGDEPQTALDLARFGWRVAPVGESVADPMNNALLLSGLEAPVRGLDGGAVEVADPRSETVPQQQASTGPGWAGNYAGTSPPLASTLTRAGDSRELFVVHGHGFGLIAAFRSGSGQGAAIGRTTPDVLNLSILGQRLDWAMRHGTTPDNMTTEFNNWLIPSVGVAPVVQFQLLITIFVFGIGPLNYWLLVRRRKLPMLLVTVPVAAALTTLLLFCYGLFADGLGIKTRVRSLTLLDQPAGEAATWARATYYAGMAPRDGLVLPLDVAAYPVQPSWAPEVRGYRGGAPSYRTVEWNKKQELRRGWLPARTPTQYLLVRARETTKTIRLRNENDGLFAENQLGVQILQLAVQDRLGRFYWAEDFGHGDRRKLPPIDRSEITRELRSKFTDNFPEFPPGGDPGSLGLAGYYVSGPSQNLMESLLEAINSPALDSWGNGHYIAVTSTGAEVDLGVDDAEEQASFHVIFGKW